MPGLSVSRPRGGRFFPWYFEDPRPTTFASVLIFDLAIHAGHVEVVHWFFSASRIAFMPATLANVLSSVADCARRTQNCELLDYLLSAQVSGVLLAELAHQQLLNRLLCWTQDSSDVIQTLLAHGATLEDDHPQTNINNGDQVLANWIAWGNERNLEIAAAEGAVLVGASLLVVTVGWGTHPIASRLLQFGIDWRGPRKNILHEAIEAKDIELVRVLINESFADVDARDDKGRTPLMVLSSLPPSQAVSGDHTLRRMAHILLEAGANADVLNLSDDAENANAVSLQL